MRGAISPAFGAIQGDGRRGLLKYGAMRLEAKKRGREGEGGREKRAREHLDRVPENRMMMIRYLPVRGHSEHTACPQRHLPPPLPLSLSSSPSLPLSLSLSSSPSPSLSSSPSLSLSLFLPLSLSLSSHAEIHFSPFNSETYTYFPKRTAAHT